VLWFAGYLRGAWFDASPEVPLPLVAAEGR
jgi:hypothetical protein